MRRTLLTGALVGAVFATGAAAHDGVNHATDAEAAAHRQGQRRMRRHFHLRTCRCPS